MIKIETPFDGLYILEPKVFGDDRGFFMESFNAKVLKDLGIDNHFVQDNHSKSSYGVIRGLHYQNAPHAQTKLIRVLNGKILDAVVDIREGSKTFGKIFTVELSSENKRQLLVPKGFAHGFSTISDTVEILYKCDDYYHPECEGGIAYNDPDLGIDWQVPDEKCLLSEKDRNYPGLKKANFKF